MEKELPNFERDLWGQYNRLHERLLKQIDYYKYLKKLFTPIHVSFADLDKKLNSMKINMDPTIPTELYIYSSIQGSDQKEAENYWHGIPLTMKVIKDIIANDVENYTQVLFHSIKNIETLILKMKEEKSEYDDFIKCLNSLSESKRTMDKNMKFYHQKMGVAEQAVIDLKKLEIQSMRITDEAKIIESKEILDIKSNQLTSDAIKPYNIYKESVKKANIIREESIKRQKNLLFSYQNIEEEIGKVNTTLSNLVVSNLKLQLEFTQDKYKQIENIKNNINIKKDIKQLIINYAGNAKPEEEIQFIHFPSTINFDRDDNIQKFEIDSQVIEYVKGHLEEEYPDYDKDLEIKKKNMRETLYKLFEKYNDETRDKVEEYIKDERTYYFFLILLSKLRTNNRFEQGQQLIEFLGKIMISILDYAEKNKLYEYAKNCIILSQTFFYKKNDNDEKYYLLEKIRNHKWLVTNDFWINFLDVMISKEINKFLLIHPEITIEDVLNRSEEIDAKMKSKISELLFSQLLPYVNNMHEFNISLKDIVNITETFNSKYNYMEESQIQAIFGLISSDQAEIERLKEDFKKSQSIKKQNENQKKNVTITPGTYSDVKNIVEKKNNSNNTINDINKNDNSMKKNDNDVNNIYNDKNNNQNTNNNTNKKDNKGNNKNNNNNKNEIETNNIGKCHTVSCIMIPQKDKINNKIDAHEKSQNKGEGKFNFSKNLKNTAKKEEKKENKTETKKDQSKVVQKKEESNTGPKKSALSAIIKASPEYGNKSANNPFGVILKKLPPNTNKG